MASGRLGCAGSIEVFVTEKCLEDPKQGKRVCTLTNIGSLTWNRVLDLISEAEVTVPIGVGTGGGANPCCGCMALVEPWCHELNIARDGVPVWRGPITEVDYGYNSVVIRARDALAWLEKRVPIGVLANAATPFELTDLGLDVLEGAFAEEDPCVLKYVYQADLNNRPTYIGPVSVSADNFGSFDQTYFDWLTGLSEIGLDFTVVGGRVILNVNSQDLPIAGVITDEHILGEIRVRKDGLLAVNRVYSRYTGDDDPEQCAANAAAGKIPAEFTVPCPAIVDGPKYCYGPLEQTLSDASGGDFANNVDTAIQFGQIYVNGTSVAPRTIEIPGGSQLSPDTPFDINELIPGMRVRAVLNNLCFVVNDVFKLTEVTYSIDADGNEAIGVTLGPLNDTLV